ncbi:MAG: response regulator transcription factor, partial [Candidatus Dormibacteraeota bacterium]|nr:response regulator transcription factor [Candidatus Dormibacteraeota bacterium]
YMRLHEATAYPAGVGKQMDEVIELAPWVAEIVDGRSVPELIDPATARFRLFDAVSQVLLRVAREEPLLVLLDDLEAADEHSLALLRHLAGSLNSGPIALVAMARPPGRRTSAALRETFDGLTRARGGRRLEMPPGPLAAATGPAEGLSRRELEVASLVSGGLSNREIGEQLFISERTAENHVQSILNKLGYSSRAQVAAWVARKGFEYRDG